MTQGDRLHILRKEALHMTLETFGKRLGVTKAAISRIENGDRGLTDQMFKFICREFHVNPSWLRDGEGEIFAVSSDYEKVKGFVDDILVNEPEGRKVRLIAALSKMTEDEWDLLYDLAMKMTAEGPAAVPDDRTQLHEELDRQMDLEKKAAERSQAI